MLLILQSQSQGKHYHNLLDIDTLSLRALVSFMLTYVIG